MNQPIDIQALRTPNAPEFDALRATINEALDEAIEQGIQSLRIVLSYAAVHPNGMAENLQQARKIEFPSDGSDPGQIAEKLVASFEKRSPGDGFVGRIKFEFTGEGEEGLIPFGMFERFVQIGEINHQMLSSGQDPYGYPQGGGGGGYGPPQPPSFGPPGGGYGPPGGGYGQPDPYGQQGFPSGPMGVDELDEEKQGMFLAVMGANERRLDMALRQNQFMLERFMEVNGHYLQTQSHVMQLAAFYMNQYQPPPQQQMSGGEPNAMTSIISGLLSMMIGGGGGSPQPPEVKAPLAPIVPMGGSIPPQPDAYQPYEPAEAPHDFGSGMDSDDITEEQAQAWADANPDGAKRVARSLLPPAMQGLIPK